MISVPGADAVPVTTHSGGYASDIGKYTMMAFGVLSRLYTPVTCVQNDSIFQSKPLL